MFIASIKCMTDDKNSLWEGSKWLGAYTDVPVLNYAPCHEDILEELVYNSMHS